VSAVTGSLKPYSADDAPELPFFAFGGYLDLGFLEKLLERPLATEAARLPGFTTLQLKDSGWSVIAPSESEAIEGMLLRHLGQEGLRRLDAYAGVGEGLYRRIAVVVETGDPARSVEENAYVHLPTDKTSSRISPR